MSIAESCQTEVVCCTPDTTIPEAAALMRKHHVGDVIVIEEQGGERIPLGILTDRDIVLETVALDVDPDVFTAGDLMTSPVATVQKDSDILETLQLMRSNRIKRVPVVTESGSLFGIVAADDILNLLAKEFSLLTEAIVDQPAREARLRK